MTNNETVKFLAVIDAETKTAILNSIAKNYGISPEEAYTEVTNSTEHLLDFLTEPIRSATKVLLARHGQVIAYSFKSVDATAELKTVSPKESKVVMSLEDWIATYKPVKRPGATGDDFASDFLYETYGDDLLAVNATDPQRVWTLVENDDDDGTGDSAEAESGMILINGAHHVNRVNYFITEVPFDDSDGQKIEIDY